MTRPRDCGLESGASAYPDRIANSAAGVLTPAALITDCLAHQVNCYMACAVTRLLDVIPMAV